MTESDLLKLLRQGQWSNRYFYTVFIRHQENPDGKKSLSEQPLSYKIYMGTEKPPTSSLTSPSSYMSSFSPTSSKTVSPISSSDSNYLDFVSLCKRVVGTK
jgi:hypothetical protein